MLRCAAAQPRFDPSSSPVGASFASLFALALTLSLSNCPTPHISLHRSMEADGEGVPDLYTYPSGLSALSSGRPYRGERGRTCFSLTNLRLFTSSSSSRTFFRRPSLS